MQIKIAKRQREPIDVVLTSQASRIFPPASEGRYDLRAYMTRRGAATNPGPLAKEAAAIVTRFNKLYSLTAARGIVPCVATRQQTMAMTGIKRRTWSYIHAHAVVDTDTMIRVG